MLYFQPPTQMSPKGMWVGWATSTLRNLGVVGLCQRRKGLANPSFFKRCGLGGHAEWERLAISPFRKSLRLWRILSASHQKSL